MTVSIKAGLSRLLPLALLDDPPNPARETMDETKLDELAQSIREVGLIEPLIVEPNGERYTVRAGHRRLMACRLSGSDPVPCIVRDPATYDAEAVMLHENIHREKLNSAEQAIWYSELCERRCGGDTEKLAALLHQDRSTVERKMNLLRGYQEVFEALQRKQINEAVAVELNKIRPESAMQLYLDPARRGGVKASQVRQWRHQHDLMHKGSTDPADGGPSPDADPAKGGDSIFRCVLCGCDDDVHAMELLYIHNYCRKVMEKQTRPPGGEPNATRTVEAARPVETDAGS